MTKLPREFRAIGILVARTRFLVAAIVFGAIVSNAPSSLGQRISPGGKIYADNAESVLLLYAKSPTGELIAQGSGFLITGNKIVTNEHVADAGAIFVQVGPARIPAKVEKLDRFNDLAILSVDVELTAKPLNLAQKIPGPGDPAYAIGNPEGLEKTISQGVISSVREIDGRQLLQVSAPLSPGSSGGPVFNADGEVVGVAVGILESGQNLNFAIPVSFVTKLLRSAATSQPNDALATLEQVQKLNDDQRALQYSSADDSPYQKVESQIRELLNRAYEEAGTDPALLVRVANLAKNDDVDLSIKAAHRSIDLKPSAAASLSYAEALYWKYIFSNSTEQPSLLKGAETAAKNAIVSAKPPSAEMYNTAAEILESESSFIEADRNFHLALNLSQTSVESGDYLIALRGLIRTSYSLKKIPDSQHWFEQLVSTGSVSSYDWFSQAGRLSEQKNYEEAGNAYSKAAAGGEGFASWCSAALNYAMTPQKDLTLSTARACIDGATGIADTNEKVSLAHREIADILSQRGVYSEALNHAKEATVLDPTAGFAYDSMAEALIGLHRFEEAVNAAQQAIRLTDGKYAFTHFRLGQAYFDLENWEFARQSFEKAAQLDPTDAPSAYNLAICLGQLKYHVEAAQWFEEYLRRNPNATDKADVLAKIRILRN